MLINSNLQSNHLRKQIGNIASQHKYGQMVIE